MNKALEIGGRLVRSRWFWVAVAVTIALLLLWKYWSHVAAWFRRDLGNYDEGRVVPDEQLRSMARSLFAAVIGFGGGVSDKLEQLSALNDSDLRYLATFYKSLTTDGASLKEHIDDEWMPHTDLDDTLIARLNQMAL